MTLTGGTGTFRFSNDNGATWTNYITTNTYTWNNVSATDTATWPIGIPYMVEDQDTSAPASQQTIYLTVTENSEIGLSITTQNESIDGQNDGSATIDVSGGVLQYDVQVNDTNGNGTLFNGSGGQTQFVFPNLAPGEYTILGADGNGCPISGSFEIAEGAPQVSIVSLIGGEIDCNGGSGNVTMTVTGGSGDYQYSVNPASSNSAGSYGSTTQLTTESWLAPVGTWWFFVKDAVTGDEVSQSVTLSQPAPIAVSFNGAETYPGANDVNLQVFISGGTAPYSITCGETNETLEVTLDSQGPTPGGTFTTINSAGTYTFSIVDDNGCTKGSTTIVQTIFTNVQVSNVISSPSCYGENAGEIIVSATGGSPAQSSGTYNYSIDGGSSYQSSGTFNNLTPGNYEVWVKDMATGEEAEWSSNPVVVSEALEIQVITSTMTDGTCTDYPEYYIKFSGSNLTSDVAANQSAQLVWTHGNNGGAYTASSNIQNITSLGSNTFEGSVPSSTWQYFGGANQAGTFNVVITSDGCEYTHGPISYTTSDPVSMSATLLSEPACPSDVWVYEVSATGGPTEDYILSISNGANLLTGWNGDATEVNVPQNSGSTVLVTAHTDYANNGCADSTTVVTTDTTALVVSGSVSNPLCATSGGSTMSFSITGGQPSGNTYKYKVSTDNGSTFGPEQSYSTPITNQSVSDGDIVIKAYRISGGLSTEGNCEVEQSIGSVTNPVAINGSIEGFSSPTGCIGANATNGFITMVVSGGTGTYDFSKDGGSTWQSLPLIGGYYTFDGLGAGTYGVVVRDSNGCEAIDDSIVLSAPASPVVSSHSFAGCWRYSDTENVELNIFLSDTTGQQNGDYTFYDPNADVQTVTDGKLVYSNSNMTTHTQGPVTITNTTTGCSTTLSNFNYVSVPSIVSTASFINSNNSGPSGTDTDDLYVNNISGGYGAPYTVELIDSNGTVIQTNPNISSGGNTMFTDVPAGFYTYRVTDSLYGTTACGRTYTTPMESVQESTNQRTIYYFHGGQTAFPYATSYLTNSSVTYYTPSDTSGNATLSDAMAYMINNGGGDDPYYGGGGVYTMNSFVMPSGQTISDDGTSSYTQWTFSSNANPEYYYLAIPNNVDFPENLTTAPPYNLMDSGVPTNAADRKAFTYNGDAYWLYRMGGGSNTITRSFGFNN